MTHLPIIDDENLSGSCCPRPAGLKEIHKIPRSLPRPTVDTSSEEVLQDEAGFAVNDEITDNFIYDDLKTF
jgi:hypothetical protein